MASVQLRGVFASEWVLTPQNESPFYEALRSLVPPGLHRRVIDGAVEKSTLSIRHKLTVMMYQAALISKLNSEEFADFEENERNQKVPLRPSEVSHHGFSVKMNNIDEYRLYLALFLETFSATAFSLLDITGHLLNELYLLGHKPDDVNFYTIYNNRDMGTKLIHPFLEQYISDKPTSVPWMKPLKRIRNRTTHRPITDVCEAEIKRRGSIFKEMPTAQADFYLDNSIFKDTSFSGTDVKLVTFVQQVYEGLEEFVEDLYNNLRQAIVQTITTKGSLPLD